MRALGPIPALGLAAALLVRTAVPVAAQMLDAPWAAGGRGLAVATGVAFETWEEDRPGLPGEPLSQATSWALTSIALHPRAQVDLFTEWASTDWDANGSSSGLRDTKATVSWRARDDVVLRLGANLPTGTTDLGLEELRLAQGVAHRLKGYRANKFGEGFDLDVGAACAFELRGWAVGLGAGWLRKGEYTVLEGQPDYDPGDQLSLVAGVDGGSEAHFWRLDAVFSSYGRDELDGEPVFRFGKRLRLEGAYRYRGGERLTWGLLGRAMLHGDSETSALPGELPGDTRANRGQEFYADAQVEAAVTPRLHLLGSAGVRLLDGNDAGGDGHRFDIGPGMAVTLAPALRLTGRFRYGFGRVQSAAAPGVETDDAALDGYGLELGLQYAGGR